MRILAFSGSLRRDSYNTGLLRCAQALAPAGVEIEIYDGMRAIPPFDDDDAQAGVPFAVASLKEAIAEADALLFATPEYNGSIPGCLKNLIDWASRPRDTTPLLNKPVAVIGASTGMFGAVWAQADLRKVLGLTGARVIGEELPVGRAQDAFVGGELAAPETRDGVVAAVEALEDAVRERVRLAA